jgi:hypothetical protein
MTSPNPLPACLSHLAQLDGPANARIESAVTAIWMREKPGAVAQTIRAEIGNLPELWAVEDDIPDWVWDLVDVAAERGLRERGNK